jgi:PEP-CTERM motif
VAAFQTGNGEVDITELAGAPAVPEPSTCAMMAAGFAALGLAGLRRRRKA